MATDRAAFNKLDGEWLEHWMGPVHESDGGYDTVGDHQQDGRQMLQDLLAKLSSEHGLEIATDDVSDEELDPQR